MFDPQGRRRLTQVGRSPTQVMGSGGYKGSNENDAIIDQMFHTALKFREKGEAKDIVLPDFLSFGQSLNVASADQRLLVFVNADGDEVKKLSPTLKALFSDEEIIGRFHLDFAGEDDTKWGKSVKGAESKPAINIIRSGKFGLDGVVVSQLPLDASLEEIKETLLADNAIFNTVEDRKEYADHVMSGKRQGIKYESAIPYGEDLDGDGEIDKPAGGRRSGGMGTGRSGRRGQGR